MNTEADEFLKIATDYQLGELETEGTPPIHGVFVHFGPR